MKHFRRFGRPRAGLILAAMLLMVSGAISCSLTGTEELWRPESQHLRLTGSAFGIPTLDPALVRDVETAFLSRQVFRGLVSFDTDLQPRPELASSYEVLEDGRRYRFHLHPHLTFHNGNPIDAEAVVRSFNRASDPALTAGDSSVLSAATYFSDIVGIDERLAGTADAIRGIRATDNLTIEFELKRPAANFLLKLTGSPAAVVDVSSAVQRDWWQRRNGSGPFRVVTHEAGQRLVLESFDGYPGGGPRLERVTVLFGSQASQPLNLYEAGSIDITELPGWAIDRVQTPTDPLHGHLVKTEQMSTTYLAFNSSFAPYDDIRARRMIAAGLDVDRMVELAYSGRVTRAHGLIPPGIGDREWLSDPVDFDLGAARVLSDAASVGDATPQIVEPGGGVGTIVQEVLARDLGIEIVVLDQPWPDFADRLTRRDLPALVLTWVADYPDPENTLATLLRSGSPDNFVGYANPEFDELVDAAAIEPDSDVRERFYLEAQQLALDDVVVIPLYHGMSYTVVQPWVRGLEVTEIGILSLDDVWIESERT